jgi:hypothetical protein
MALKTGWHLYALVPASDTDSAVTIDGGSSKNGAGASVQPFNGRWYQAFWASLMGGTTYSFFHRNAGYAYITGSWKNAVNSNGFLCANTTYAKRAENAPVPVVQGMSGGASGWTTPRWTLAESGTVEVNGYAYTGYLVEAYGGQDTATKWLLTAEDDGRLTVRAEEADDGGEIIPGQRWAFVEWTQSGATYPTCVDGAARISEDGTDGSVFAAAKATGLSDVVVTGASVQDGTPSLEAPATIRSAEVTAIRAGGQTVPAPGVTLRAFGDAADTWDVATGEVTRRVLSADVSTWGVNEVKAGQYVMFDAPVTLVVNQVRSDRYATVMDIASGNCYVPAKNLFVVCNDAITDEASARSLLEGVQFEFALAEPSTENIGAGRLPAVQGTSATVEAVSDVPCTATPTFGDVDMGSVYPTFTWSKSGTATNRTFQVRYRTRTRQTGSDVSEWSDWSLIDGDGGSWGWGSNQDSMGTTVKCVGGKYRYMVQTPVTAALGASDDLFGIEFSARACYLYDWRGKDSFGSSNTPIGWGVNVVRGFEISSVAASMAPDGLIIAWESDWKRDGCTATVSDISDPAAFDAQTAANVNGSDSITIPMGKVNRKLGNGDALAIRVELTTGDGYKVAVEKAVTVTDDIPTTLTASATVEGTRATVTCADGTASLWLVIPRAHGVNHVELGTGGTWTVYPPLNREWTVYVSGEKGRGYTTFPAVEARGHLITSQDGRHEVCVLLNEEKPVDYEASYRRSRDDYETVNRERPVYGFAPSTSAGWDVKGVLLGGYDATGEEEWLAHASHVLYRNQSGIWAQCAVDSVSITPHPEYREVSVKLDEEVW